MNEIRDVILEILDKDIVAYFVFEEISRGCENREIASSLGVDVKDVQNAKKRICRIIAALGKRE